MKIANAINRDPLELIALANMEREKNSERKEYWRKIAGTGVATALLFGAFSDDYQNTRSYGINKDIQYTHIITFL